MLTAHDTALDSAALQPALAAFRRAHPGYNATRVLDELRATEYRRLDDLGHIYLDYTGGGLYADSQLRAHLDLLRRHVFGNPHSENPTSRAMTARVEQARAAVLDFFNASPDDYAAIFTLNASGALKLVGESYPFAPGSHYLLTFDNHNSVNGIREFARAKGAAVTYAPVLPPDMRLDEGKLSAHLERARAGAHQLFAYPAQSNFSGVQHSLEWVGRAQARGWDVLLDAAAFVPTNRLDLRRWQPDFVPLSFYKMFGYPTGVGCLIARKAALAKLRRPWFAGGTILCASVQADDHRFAEGEAAFEDGTVNYLSLPAVEIGLRHLASIGIDTVHERLRCLTSWLIEQLLTLHHRNGRPLIRLYGPTDTHGRGGTVTVNFFDPNDRFIHFRIVEARANDLNISLRTGCFCNPGADELASGLTPDELAACFHQDSRMTLDEFALVLNGKSAGAVRVSLGLATNFADVFQFVAFARSFLDRPVESLA